MESRSTHLGFDYTFETHDGIQDAPYIYFENSKPVTHLAYRDGSWDWARATKQPMLVEQAKNPASPGYLSPDPDGNGVEQVFRTCVCDCPPLTEYMRNTANFSYCSEQDDIYKTTKQCSDPNNMLTAAACSARVGTQNCPCNSRASSCYVSKVLYAYPDWDATKTGEVYTSAARRFIRESSGQRFFLQFNSQAVHIPHIPDTFFGQQVRGTHPTRHLDMVREVDLQVGSLTEELLQSGTFDATM